MGKSIIQEDKACYICGRPDVENHHCLHGTANRKNADKYNLTVWLCHEHHMKVHSDRDTDLYFMQLAQKKFEEKHTREQFMTVFGKSWL